MSCEHWIGTFPDLPRRCLASPRIFVASCRLMTFCNGSLFLFEAQARHCHLWSCNTSIDNSYVIVQVYNSQFPVQKSPWSTLRIRPELTFIATAMDLHIPLLCPLSSLLPSFSSRSLVLLTSSSIATEAKSGCAFLSRLSFRKVP